MRQGAILLALLALSFVFLVGHATLRLPTAIASHAPATSPYATFVGTWFHHGGQLRVTRNGQGRYSYRLYVFCNTQRTTACDKLANNTIYAGGFSAFTLHRVSGNKAYGSMDNSSFSWQVGTTITLVARPNDTLVIYEAGAAPRVACGPKAPAGFCGA